MTPSSTSSQTLLLLLSLLLPFLIASSSAKTTISFYRKPSCAPDSPSAGDAFESDDLAAGSGLCYMPPAGAVAMEIEEIGGGCSVTAYLDSTCSMPTSESLTLSSSSSKPPCYFLSPSDYIGSFSAKCSSSSSAADADEENPPSNPSSPSSSSITTNTTTTTTTTTSRQDRDDDKTDADTENPDSNPSLQSEPVNGGAARQKESWALWGPEVGIKALMAMGTVEVAVWGWGVL